jgi:hypothetical protein
MKTVNSFSNEKRHHENNAPCVLERTLTFGEIAELSEQCEAVQREVRSVDRFSPPLTFVVPAYQVVASISRLAE